MNETDTVLGATAMDTVDQSSLSVDSNIWLMDVLITYKKRVRDALKHYARLSDIFHYA